MSKKALILTWESYQDHEVVYPFYRVQEEGFSVDIMANKVGRIFGILGTYNECTQSVYDLDDQKLFDKLEIISVAEIFAETIKRINSGESVSSLFK